MSDKTWVEALSNAPKNRSVRVNFDNLGISGDISPLSDDEIEECEAMGDGRGQKYAVYLACEDIRQAGKELCDRGEMIIPFDAMERLPAEDIKAVYDVVCKISSQERDVHSQGGKGSCAPLVEETDKEQSGAGDMPSIEAIDGSEGAEQPLGIPHQGDISSFTEGAEDAVPVATVQDFSFKGRNGEQFREIDIDYIAGELCRRLIDAAASM